MGRLVRWSKRTGWEVGPTPYQYHIMGLHFFQRAKFKSLRRTLFSEQGRKAWQIAR